MKTSYVFLLFGGLVLSGCAAPMTQAELFGDPRDSLTVQQTHPKMFARPDTTVGVMRVDFRECANRPDGVYAVGRKYNGSILPGGPGDLGAQAADYFTLGTTSTVATREAMGRTAACMRDKGYSQASSTSEASKVK
jgi:hypothetical protein